MTVLYTPDFEAEALDLDHIPDEDEMYPGKSIHVIGPLDAEVRLVGTRRRYQVALWWYGGEAHLDGIPVNIWTGTEAANNGLSAHAAQGRLLKVILGAVTFTARLTISRHGDSLTIADLFRHEPFDWGLRGDPYLWKDMRDYFENWVLPDSIAELDRRIAIAFEHLTGASIDSKEPVFNPQYDMGGMSSGHIDPGFWRSLALDHLREQLEYDRDWKRPRCPDCSSDNVARIVYGYPDLKMMDDEQEGRIKLGGCCVTEDDPEWHCWMCERDW